MDTAIKNAWIVFFTWLPKLAAAIVILIIGYLIAKVIESLVRRGLNAVKLDNRLHASQGGTYIQKAVPRPANLIGSITFWALMLATLSLSATTLGIGALSAFVAVIYSYVPNLLAAALIFLVAGALSTGASAFVARTMGETMTGKVVATAAPVVILSVAGFMILEQLKIATGIVLITYSLILGSVALGMALAFGLGGRDVARRLLETSYEKGQESADQVKADFRQGARRQREAAGAFYEQVKPDNGQGQPGPRADDYISPPGQNEGGPDGIIRQ